MADSAEAAGQGTIAEDDATRRERIIALGARITKLRAKLEQEERELIRELNSIARPKSPFDGMVDAATKTLAVGLTRTLYATEKGDLVTEDGSNVVSGTTITMPDAAKWKAAHGIE